MENKYSIISTEKSWIEGEAVEQLKNAAKLSGMIEVVGMPDLHPGKGFPIGAAFISENVIYPFLIGGDIGCGMSLYQTDLLARKVKVDKLIKRLQDLEGPWGGNLAEWRDSFGVMSSEFDQSLGTIGAGNHFAEFVKLDRVEDEKILNELNADPNYLFLLIHSGSRGYGESILRGVTAQFQNNPLTIGSDVADDYLSNHEDALRWAKANRSLIAKRFCEAVNIESSKILEIEHNSLTQKIIEGKTTWIHRKGAAPSDQGPVIIPGSRGAHTYLVSPIETNKAGWSLAHGAGRKWKRSEARGRIKEPVKNLSKTGLGSRVICTDKNLMYEEAPQAYKDIEQVIEDLKHHNLIECIARFSPVITFKTQRQRK